MTNATKTIGGAIASAIFAIALASTGSIERPGRGPRAAVAATSPSGRSAPSPRCSPRGALRCMPPPGRTRPGSLSRGCLDGHLWARRPGDRPRIGTCQRARRPRTTAAEPRPTVDAPDGRPPRRARMQQQQTWVDLQIRQAMERGEFDDLPGAGKPIEGLGDQHDPDWWLKKLVEREHDRRAAAEPRAAQGGRRARRPPRPAQRRGEVRREVEDFNERVIAGPLPAARGPAAGHRCRATSTTTVAAWRERRTARRSPSSAARRRDAVAEPATARRQRR